MYRSSDFRPHGYEARTDEGTGTAYSYDCRGNRVRTINGLGQLVKEQAYNLQDLPVAEKDGLGNETGLNYTLDGQVKDVTRGSFKEFCIRRVLTITKVSTLSVLVLRILFLRIDEVMIGLRTRTLKSL